MSDVITQDFIEKMSTAQAGALAAALGPYLSGEKTAEYHGYVPEGLIIRITKQPATHRVMLICMSMAAYLGAVTATRS
jgi:hypothetical protein